MTFSIRTSVVRHQFRTMLITASFLVLIPACSSSGGRPHNSFDHQLRLGEYLREDYIDALCSTLSPLKATRPDDFPQLIVVARDEIGLSLMPIHNFHEGDEPYRVARDGTLKQNTNALRQDMGQFTIRDTGCFNLRKGATMFRFRFVENAERWVSTAVIAGSYRDGRGVAYVFDHSGKAHFPGREAFSYTLGLDHVLTDHDYIYSSDLKTSWAAYVSQRRLSLHDESGDDIPIVSPTPHWILTRTSPPNCTLP